MKLIFNWRYHVTIILFAVGFIAVAGLFDDSAKSVNCIEWLKQICLLLSVAAVSFYALYRLTKKWEAEGKIPRTNNKTTP